MKLHFIALLLLISTSCSLILKTGNNTITESHLINTTWAYSDSKDDSLKYEITFLRDGKFASTHPNETTPDNDTWEINNGVLHFYTNNKYAHYTSNYYKQNTLKGTSINKRELSWEWELNRIYINK